MHIKLRLLLLICATLFLLTGQLIAQEDNEGEREDDIFASNISIDGDIDDYRISLTEGELVIITAEATPSSPLDTQLYLLGPGGLVVAENDDYEFPASTNSRIIYTAEETGDYTINITNYPSSIGNVGNYEITVSYSSTGSFSDPQSYSGFLDDTDTVDRYPITLNEGQGVLISTESIESEALDTVLSIENSDGTEVAYNDDIVPRDNLDSEIVYLADTEDNYTVIVRNIPNTNGTYQLTITLLTSEQVSSMSVQEGAFKQIDTTPKRDPNATYEGIIIDADHTRTYRLHLDAGDRIIAALYATSSSLDARLTLIDPSDVPVLYNDVRWDYATSDAQLAFTAPEDGRYTLAVNGKEGFVGSYLLEIFYATLEEVRHAEQAMRGFFAHLTEQHDTENFRIHYTTEGEDAIAGVYARSYADTLEDVFAYQLALGWARPPTDWIQGGDERYDVYIIHIPPSENIGGFVSSSSPLIDNPNTDQIETAARASYIVIDNDFDTAIYPSFVRNSVIAHEVSTMLLNGYDDEQYDDFTWLYQSTSQWMVHETFPEVGYGLSVAIDVFDNPELCFGRQDFADVSGNAIYGSWLFLEFIQNQYAQDAPFILWETMLAYRGWQAVEVALAPYNVTVPQAIASYHLNNLVRDYDFADSFDEVTVALTSRLMNDRILPSNGIQELGARYFHLDVPDGRYEVTLTSTSELELYAIGINGDVGRVSRLNEGVTIQTTGFDEVYLMVFNPDYDDDLGDCEYTYFDIAVADSTDTLALALTNIDASNFRNLE